MTAVTRKSNHSDRIINKLRLIRQLEKENHRERIKVGFDKKTGYTIFPLDKSPFLKDWAYNG
jgi:predicted ATPase